MRFLSTERSVAESEPTIVAIAETLLAVAISIAVAIRYQTLTHVALSSCIAPLLLMRSQESVALGVRWFNCVKPKKPPTENALSIGWIYLRILVSSAAVKVAATASHPVKGTQNVPTNWVRVVLCTDIRTPVELVPGLGPARETLKSITTHTRASSFGFLLLATVLAAAVWGITHHYFNEISHLDNLWWRSFVEGLEPFALLLGLIFALGLACYVVAYLYRLSLKSTAIIWLPLIYVVHTTFDKTVSLSLQLDEMRQSALWKLIRLISWVTLALLASKILVLPTIIDAWNSQPWTKVLNVYVMPNEIHPWHLATGLNSAIALFGFYYFVDRAPRRMLEGIWRESTVLSVLQSFVFIRGMISIYTIFAGLSLTVVAAESMKWPEWSWKIVPW